MDSPPVQVQRSFAAKSAAQDDKQKKMTKEKSSLA
jgi:hypothetical protein